MPRQWSTASARGPPTDSRDMPPSPSASCSALLSSHATLLTINRTRTAGPFDCVIPRSSRVPMLKSPRSQQLQAYARVCQLAPVCSIFFSPHRLPPRQSGTAWPVCRPPTGPLNLCPPPIPSPPPLLSVLTGWRPTGCGADRARFFCRKQGSSSFLPTPTVPPPTHEIGCHNPDPSSNKR